MQNPIRPHATQHWPNGLVYPQPCGGQLADAVFALRWHFQFVGYEQGDVSPRRD